MLSRQRFQADCLQALQSVYSVDHMRIVTHGGRRLTLGIPTRPAEKNEEKGRLYMDPAVFPYIYKARLNVRLGQKDATLRYAIFDDVVVIDAHGYRDKDQVWKFGDGQPVVDTILEYNTEYAPQHGLPPVQFALICNKDFQRRTAKETERLQKAGIIFARDGIVSVMPAPKISVSGFITLDVETEGEFVNLERMFQKLQGAGLNSLVEDNLLNHS